MGNTAVDPATEIYDVAQAEMKIKLQRMESELAAVKDDAYALGILKKIEYDNAHNEFLEHVVLFNIKRAKEYKKGGMTWKGFCDALGKNVRTVDRALDDISPFVKQFSDKMSDLSGLNFSKIRYLGRSFSDNLSEITENGIKIDDGEVIPLDADHKDEIEAYIDSLKRSEKEAKDEREKDLTAKQRVIKTLHETIDSQADKLTKFEKATPGKDSALDKEQLRGLQELKAQFELFSKGMSLGANLYLYNASEQVKAEYFADITYARQMIERLWEDAGNDLGFPALPGTGGDDTWEPEAWQEPESAG